MYCSACLGLFPMYAFTHGEETDCKSFRQEGERYCYDCYCAESTISHLKREPCKDACHRRQVQLIKAIGASARRLSVQLDPRDLREQADQFAMLRRVQARKFFC